VVEKAQATCSMGFFEKYYVATTLEMKNKKFYYCTFNEL
jgi:hypothetical protein